MKYFLLLFLFEFSCDLKPAPDSIEQFDNKFIAKEKSDTCIYLKRKLQSQKLGALLKQNPSKTNELLYLKYIVDSLIPCWYGTAWGFYGTTREPGNGAIACGYFVTTVLQDAGISLNRIKLSQCPSEEMIKKLSSQSSISRFSNKPLSTFAQYVKEKELGLYIIGLDFHTGFIYHNGEDLYFIHASYAVPKVVRKENVIESSILAASKYKVIGRVNLNVK